MIADAYQLVDRRRRSEAEVAFTSSAGMTTVRAGNRADSSSLRRPWHVHTRDNRRARLLAVAPELAHSPVRIVLAPKSEVRGLTLFLFPAVDYFGTVVDARGAPVAGARVELAAPPEGEQMLEQITTEWTTDAKGEFVFHAPDDSVLAATKGSKRGWGVLDGNVPTRRT